MPAIHLARLRQSSAQLVDSFESPEIFIRKLHILLSEYSDRTFRPGKTGEPAPLLESYNVPKPVIRQLLIDTNPRVYENPLGALNLCDELWKESYFEMRWLAASILGQVIPDPAEPIMERIRYWCASPSEDQITAVLLDKGLERIRIEKPESLIDQIDRWLSDPNPAINKLGLQALTPLISTSNYENIPFFFHQISPFVRELPSSLRMDMRDVVKKLATRSPVETAHFLRQFILSSSNVNAAWLTRQNLRFFPSEVQESLRELLRSPQPDQ